MAAIDAETRRWHAERFQRAESGSRAHVGIAHFDREILQFSEFKDRAAMEWLNGHKKSLPQREQMSEHSRQISFPQGANTITVIRNDVMSLNGGRYRFRKSSGIVWDRKRELIVIEPGNKATIPIKLVTSYALDRKGEMLGYHNGITIFIDSDGQLHDFSDLETEAIEARISSILASLSKA